MNKKIIAITALICLIMSTAIASDHKVTANPSEFRQGESTIFIFETTSSARIHFRIYPEDDLINTVFNTTLMDSYRLPWTGTTNHGRQLDAGNYLYRAYFGNPCGRDTPISEGIVTILPGEETLPPVDPYPGETMTDSQFVHEVAKSGGINYSAIGVCSTDSEWCKKPNINAISFAHSSADHRYEILMYPLRDGCNPPHSTHVGCSACVLFFGYTTAPPALPKWFVLEAIAKLRTYQSGAPPPDEKKDCPDVPHGQCSTDKPGYRCDDGKYVKDPACADDNDIQPPPGNPPTITNIKNDPPSFDNRTQTTTFKVEGSNIEEIKIRVLDLGGLRVFESPFVDGTEYVWDGKNNAGQFLAYGIYRCSVTAKNAHGQVSKSCDVFNHRIHISAPSDDPPPTNDICQEDGTPYGECSVVNIGKYCHKGDLIDRCTQCGCPDDYVCNELINKCYPSCNLICLTEFGTSGQCRLKLAGGCQEHEVSPASPENYCEAGLTCCCEKTDTDTGITVSVAPNPFDADTEEAVFTATADDGKTINEISLRIYDLTNNWIFDSGWVSGNTTTWNGVGNRGVFDGTEMRSQAYRYVVEAKVGDETRGPEQGPVYIKRSGDPVIETCDDGTPYGECSTVPANIGYRCVDGVLVEDPTCDDIVIEKCDDGTPYGECSTVPENIGKRCVDGVLVEDPTCDDIVIEKCDDGTPYGECSTVNIGYRCVDGELVEDPNCDDIVTEECLTDADCPCDGACYNGVCIHPELTLNASADQILAYTGQALETTISWTITNAGEHDAVLQEITPTGCEGVTCRIRVPDTIIRFSAPLSKPLKAITGQRISLDRGEKEQKEIDFGGEVLRFSDNFKFEFGEVEATLDWQHVKFDNIYNNPIVVAKPVESDVNRGRDQKDMVVVRIKNIQSNAFELKLQDWSAILDEGLKIREPSLERPYKVQYLVMEEGEYEVNGLTIEAGAFEAGGLRNLRNFNSDFSETPVLITSPVTFFGEYPIVTRSSNPCELDFPLSSLCEHADFFTRLRGPKGSTVIFREEEKIHYVAISPGKAEINDTQWEVRRVYGIDDDGATILYESNFLEEPVVIADFQTINDSTPVMLRYSNKTRESIHFFAAEENTGMSGSTWYQHDPEDVGYIAIAPIGEPLDIEAVIKTDKDACESAPCTVEFDGSESKGPIVSYGWDFDDGSGSDRETVSHTFSEEGSYIVRLTVFDAAGNSHTATKTIVVGTDVPPVKGVVLSPGQSIRVTQTISGLSPGKHEFGLNVDYSDVFGLTDKKASEWRKAVVEVATLGNELFHSKLVIDEKETCIGPDGLVGITGKAAAPRIRFAWAFTGANSIAIDACDAGSTGIYCDPTQFSIALAKKLNKVYELSGSNKFAEIQNYTSFKARLIGDNYSENFQKDFTEFYTGDFLAAPAWFSSPSTPWHRYFRDPEFLEFSPRQIESGLYEVTISFEFEEEEFEFFAGGDPSAKIRVSFNKLREAEADIANSPLYFMPFHGGVGGTSRPDYGLGFSNAHEAIPIALVGNTELTTNISGGARQFSTEFYNDFDAIRKADGRVLEIGMAGNNLKMYASQPMPLIMGIKSKDYAEGFYQVYDRQTALGSGQNSMASWTGIAASPGLNCGDFHGWELPYLQPDISAESLGLSCAANKNNLPAFGFKWENPPSNESIFLKSIFYSPVEGQFSIANACTSDFCLMASPNGLSRGIENPLSLESAQQAEFLQNVIDLMEKEFICMAPETPGSSPSQGNYVFFWNPQKLDELLDSAKPRIANAWSFNWPNYKCE